jgi:hypothetical protein
MFTLQRLSIVMKAVSFRCCWRCHRSVRFQITHRPLGKLGKSCWWKWRHYDVAKKLKCELIPKRLQKQPLWSWLSCSDWTNLICVIWFVFRFERPGCSRNSGTQIRLLAGQLHPTQTDLPQQGPSKKKNAMDSSECIHRMLFRPYPPILCSVHAEFGSGLSLSCFLLALAT